MQNHVITSVVRLLTHLECLPHHAVVCVEKVNVREDWKVQKKCFHDIFSLFGRVGIINSSILVTSLITSNKTRNSKVGQANRLWTSMNALKGVYIVMYNLENIYNMFTLVHMYIYCTFCASIKLWEKKFRLCSHKPLWGTRLCVG